MILWRVADGIALASLTRGHAAAIHWVVKTKQLFLLHAIVVLSCGSATAQQGGGRTSSLSESEVASEAVPAAVVSSAVAAVAKLGDEVVLGRYQAAVDRMNPLWKDRVAKRMGGMEKLDAKLEGVAAQMVRQGISMISFKPQGKPQPYEVYPGKKTVTENGVKVEKLVFTKWMILVPTTTRFRIMREGNPKPLIIESTGYQVAISDKAKNDWTFIDGASLNANDLRSLFITLPRDIKLPKVEKREVR